MLENMEHSLPEVVYFWYTIPIKPIIAGALDPIARYFRFSQGGFP